MPKNLTIRDEVYPYPVNGDSNYGEAATGWAEDVTDVLSDITGPGDIPTTEIVLVGTSDGTHTTGTITNFVYDTNFVQNIEATGFIKRTYSDAKPDKIESFVIVGNFDSSEINFSVEFTGDDTDFDFTVSGGQFGFKYLDDPDGNDNQVTVKFKSTVIIDDSFFE